MRLLKPIAHLLIAALLLVPGVARARQKLDSRPDLKPSASFKDVDRPPKPVLDPVSLTATSDTCVDVAIDRDTHSVVDAIVEMLARIGPYWRCQTLRAPPRSTLG